MDKNMMGQEADGDFEPQQFRLRANTWPNRPVELQLPEQSSPGETSASPADPTPVPKKSNSRRNAWGNMSYAELITKAIESSPDQRLTLAQIYDWMVKNVAYFRDKGDNNSSAGWKNSIRHNLSLHTRFARVPNESTGKSSWWIINPDAKQSKAQRRPRDRASSMDTQKYMAKRRNAKKNTEYKRTAALAKGDLVSNSTDDLHYQLSPQPLCERSGSNTSSLHQLSPVPVLEDLLDDTASHWPAQNENFSESLAQSFASVSVQDSLQRRLNTPSPRQSLNVSGDGTSPNYSGINDAVDLKNKPSLLETLLDAPSPPNPHVSQMNNPNRSPLTKSQVNVPNNTVSMLREALLSKNPQLVQLHLQQQQMQNFPDPGFTVQPNSFPIKQEPIYHFSEQDQNAVNDFDLFQDQNNGRQYPMTIKQEFPNQIQHPDSLPDLKDIDISNDVDMSCNLDEIINQELDMEGTLEFNFDPTSGHNGNGLTLH